MIVGQLSGSTGKTSPPFILTDNGFKEGTHDISIRSDELGSVETLKLIKKSVDNTQSAPWTFEAIEIDHLGAKKKFKGKGKILSSIVKMGVKEKKNGAEQEGVAPLDTT